MIIDILIFCNFFRKNYSQIFRLLVERMEDNSVKRGRERPKPQVQLLGEIISTPRRPGAKTPNVTPTTQPPAKSSHTPSSSHGNKETRMASKVYLLDNMIKKFSYTKLPKNSAVLQRFLSILEEVGSVKLSAEKTTSELKDVWKHHFGLRLVHGVDFEGDIDVIEGNKLILMDDKIHLQIIALHKTWRDLFNTSRRENRCKREPFKAKEKLFLEETLNTPMNIAKSDPKTILKYKSGILEWQEDLTHLQNQLDKEHIGGVVGFDKNQKIADDEKILEDQLVAAENSMIFDNNNDKESDDEDNWVEEENESESEKKCKKKKIDVMSKITGTGDRLGMSVRQKAMFAASVCNATSVPISETNISKTTAWRRGRENRIAKSADIREEFVKPEFVVVHWDGKIMKLQALNDETLSLVPVLRLNSLRLSVLSRFLI